MELGWAGALVSVVALGSSGIGRLLLGRAAFGSTLRTVAAQFLVGLLAYSALIGLAILLRARFEVAVALVVGFGLLGVYGCSRAVTDLWPELSRRLLLALGLGATFAACGLLPVNPTSSDAYDYAFTTSTLFHDAWFIAHAPPLSELWYATFKESYPFENFPRWNRDVITTRGASLALPWVWAALGLGVGIEHIFVTAAWLLVAVLVLLADTLRHLGARLGFSVLAVGGIGAYNATAVVDAGQLQQPFALLVVVGAVWLFRNTASERARLTMLSLSSFLLLTGYTEFALVYPLYLGCLLLLHAWTTRALLRALAALALGPAFVLLSSGQEILRYIRVYSTSTPGWWPLPGPFDSLAYVWPTIILGGAAVWWLPLATIPAAWYLWRGGSVPRLPPLERWQLALLAAAALVMVAAWTWVLSRSGNLNYATFKLAAWLGPGLCLFSWLLLQRTRTRAQPLIAAGLLGLAAARAVAYGFALETDLTATRPPHLPANYRIAQGTAGCTLEVPVAYYFTLVNAIARTAAPVHECSVLLPAASTADYRGQSEHTAGN